MTVVPPVYVLATGPASLATPGKLVTSSPPGPDSDPVSVTPPESASVSTELRVPSPLRVRAVDPPIELGALTPYTLARVTAALAASVPPAKLMPPVPSAAALPARATPVSSTVPPVYVLAAPRVSFAVGALSTNSGNAPLTTPLSDSDARPTATRVLPPRATGLATVTPVPADTTLVTAGRPRPPG